MNNTTFTLATTFARDCLKELIETDLQSFLLDTNADLNDAVDWVCDRYDMSATDELIDVVADVVEGHYGY